MANAEAALSPESAPRSGKLKSLLAGLVLSTILGGAGFYAAHSGLLPIGTAAEKMTASPKAPELPAIAFIPIPSIVVSLGPDASARHLRFQAQLEVDKAHADDVTHLMPRVVDILNGYLRAVDPSEFEQPGALISLRAQMLRRAQLVAGETRIRDLLIMEFVLN